MRSYRVGHDWSDLAVAWNYFEFSFVDSCIVCENDSVICFFLVILSFLFFSVFIWWLLLVKQRKMAIFFFSVWFLSFFFLLCLILLTKISNTVLNRSGNTLCFLTVSWFKKKKALGKTRDLFKKIRDTKGTFHAKMGTIKDRNGMDLTEAEDIKKRLQEYTEGL